MNAITKIIAEFQEDGTAVVLARVCADDGTGAATGVDGEGNWIKVADLTSITRTVYDLTLGTTIAGPTTLTLADVIFDTPVTSRTLWTLDFVGWNLKDRLPATSFPTGGNRYLVEYLFVTTGSSKWALQAEGIASPVKGS